MARAVRKSGVVLALVTPIFGALRALLRPRGSLVLKNLALRR
jgi:hypothetical protein